jgi:urease accessory protein
MSLARLLQLASPTLPVGAYGAYSYSQGLESAIDAGLVKDAASAQRWIGDVLHFSVGRMDAPLLLLLLDGSSETDRLNQRYLASRETAELRAETVQMGGSLVRLLADVGVEAPSLAEPAFPTAYAHAARAWGIEPNAALQAYLWSWLENQVMAAVKAVPLGQTAGQKMLLALGEELEPIARRARGIAEGEFANFAPGLAFLSSKHETQYSRLFRS